MPDEKTTITIEIEGVTVVGEITERWQRYVGVKLLRPFTHLSSGCSVPYFAIKHANFAGPQGEAMARTLLAELYRNACFFHEHGEELRASWGATQDKLARLQTNDPDAPDVIAMAKRELRRRFRAREVDQRWYQNEMRVLRGRSRAYDNRRRDVIDTFMARPCPDGVDLGQVVPFILAEDEVGG